jgi:pantoate--beta-alanine ligase
MTELVETIAELRLRCDEARGSGARVGLVPTMGYLHEGHRSLVRAARAADDFVVVSIFVNPLQFGPNEDLDRYPRDLEADLAACEQEGADIVFAPSVSEMYPGPPATTVHVQGLTGALCGVSRPTHFDGVTTVVTKLLSLVGPCHAYFGRKDAQQLAVVTRMVEDLNLPVAVVGCPLVREADGLALSSRNAYLSAEERIAATVLSRALRAGAEIVAAGERDPARVLAVVRGVLASEPLVEPEYVELRDAREIAPVERVDGALLLAVAAHLGTTRLIDNVGLVVVDDRVDIDLGVVAAAS